jgi:hypothetical protein
MTMILVWTGVALWLGLNAAIALRCVYAPERKRVPAKSDRPHLRLV